MQFSRIINQQEVQQQLVELIQHNRLSHALLFLSKEGSGALSLALALAQYLTCERTTDNGRQTTAPSLLFQETSPPSSVVSGPLSESCGICPSCLKASQLVHPDIHYSYPVVTKKPGTPPVSVDYAAEWREFIKLHPYGNVYDWLQFIGAENKQGNITANECNEIIRKLSLKSFESEYKVLLMWMPEYLGTEGNKLLKLIEEPPPNTLFILVAENESLILPTIISRTQLVKIPALETGEIAEALVKRANLSPEQSRQTAAVSEGNYREALLMIQHAEEDWQGILRGWLNAILKTGPAAQVKWVDDTSKLGRERQKQFLRYFNHLLEQAIRLQTMGEENFPLPANEKDFADRLNKIATVEQQQAIIQELDNAIYYIERNANAKLLFHALTIKLYHIIAHNELIAVS